MVDSNFFDFQLIPDMHGFSFQDKGYLKIKYFDKEILSLVDFSKPIYNLSPIKWIDSNNFYFSAKSGDKSFIAQMNIINNKMEIVEENDFDDILYPQKIGSNLFYIEKHIETIFRTPKIYYKIVVSEHNKHNKKIICDFDQRPIFFLNMINKDEGFVIEYEKNIDSCCSVIHFFCYRIKNANEDWNYEKIFEFDIPFIQKELHGSIRPFLPAFFSEKIFFCNYDENNLSVDIYCYDMLKKEVDKKTNAKKSQIYFAPLIFENKVFYGMSLDKNEKLKNIAATFKVPFFEI